MASPQQILADPNFHALPLAEQLKVMRTVDPNFAVLPTKEQGTVIYQAKQKAVYPQGIPGENGPEDRGFIGTLLSDLGGMASTGAKLAIAPSIYGPEIGENIVRSHIDTGKKALDAYKRGNAVEAMGYGVATMLPMLGPMAAQTGEEVGGGQTGQGLAHGLELLAPPAVKAASEIPAVSAAASKASKVAKVKVKGAYEGAKSSADLSKSGMGAAVGEFLGQQLGWPHYLGAELGAGLPMARGAIRGMLDAKVPPPATPPPIPFRGFPPSDTWAPSEPLPIRTSAIPEYGPTISDLRGAATELRTKAPIPSRRTAPTADLSLPSEPLPVRTYGINTLQPVEQPPIPLRNIEPPAAPKIPPVEGTKNMLNIDIAHLGELPEEYVSKIKGHNSPLNAANKDAAMVGYLKSRGVTTKAQFDGASDFQHQEWNRESDVLRGVKTRPMNADAKARLRLLLK